MKRIDAYLQPHRLHKVVTALHALPNFPGFTLLDAHGQGRGRGAGGHFVYSTDGLVYHERVVMIVYCEDQDAETVARTIASAARTGNKGDGIVAISGDHTLLRISSAGGPP